MTDISGRYEFHRDASSPGMQIVRVDPSSGQILEGQVGQNPINGQYDDGTKAIAFNDARQPGDEIYVTHYTGFVMLNSDGSVYGMAGTYQESVLPRVLLEARLAPLPTSDAPAAGAAAAVAATRQPAITTVQGAWYAIRLDEPLV
jgi:hypothetical protein